MQSKNRARDSKPAPRDAAGHGFVSFRILSSLVTLANLGSSTESLLIRIAPESLPLWSPWRFGCCFQGA